MVVTLVDTLIKVCEVPQVVLHVYCIIYSMVMDGQNLAGWDDEKRGASELGWAWDYIVPRAHRAAEGGSMHPWLYLLYLSPLVLILRVA